MQASDRVPFQRADQTLQGLPVMRRVIKANDGFNRREKGRGSITGSLTVVGQVAAEAVAKEIDVALCRFAPSKTEPALFASRRRRTRGESAQLTVPQLESSARL